MRENKITFHKILIALTVLMAVSAYRQFYLQTDPGNQVYPYVVHIVYLGLLLPWGVSLSRRLSQESLRRCFYGEYMAMLIWEIVRFLQVTVLADRLYLLRISGYWMIFPVVMTPLMGFYSAMFLSRGKDYKLPKGLYFLLILAAILIITNLTNEYHQIIFRKLPGEALNLSFHPNWGFLILAAWIAVLMTARVILIFEKSHRNRDFPHLRYLPFLVSIMFAVVTVPSVAVSLAPAGDFMELSAKLYFLEVLVWETCIMVGMIPVNRQYGQVFERSTVAMQITDPAGNTLVASSHAPILSRDTFRRLKEQGSYELDRHQQLHIHPIKDGFFLWQEDHSQLHRTLEELQKTAGELKAESELLQEEIHTKSEKIKTEARSKIYDTLSTEVQHELDLLEDLVRTGSGDPDRWKKVCLLGTFIKRYCNLRLIGYETGTISWEDLRYTLEEYMDSVRRFGTRLSWTIESERAYRADYILHILNALERLEELTDFQLRSLEVSVGGETVLRAETDSPPAEMETWKEQWSWEPGRITVRLKEENADVEAG